MASQNVDSDAPPAKAKKKGQLSLQDVGIKGSAPTSVRQAKFVVKEGRQTTLKENIEKAIEKRGRTAITQAFEKGAAKRVKIEETVEAAPTKKKQLTLKDVGVKGYASKVIKRP